MKLLHEEFFGKIWKVIKEIKIIPIRLIVKFIFYIMVLVIFSIIAWLVITKNYFWLMVLVGVVILGEVAHFIRKSREQVMNKIIEIKNDLKDEIKNPLNKTGLVLAKEEKNKEKKVKEVFKEKVLNKEGLLSKK